MFPKANPLACDLLKNMLTFNPHKRATVEECLAHPYLEDLHCVEDEKISSKVFDWSVDDFKPKEGLLRSLVFKEAVKMKAKRKRG